MSRRITGKKSGKDQISFNFTLDIKDILKLEGGDQENLSDFEFRLRLKLKDVLDDAAKRKSKPLDRTEVAARISRKLGREISKTQLDQWIALSAVQKRIHVDSLKALCEVVEDFRPLHFFVESCGLKALEPEDAVCAEYGAKMLMRKMLDSELRGVDIDEDKLKAHLVKRIQEGKIRP